LFVGLRIYLAEKNQQEGLAECIANEDGERQIACAVSFHGEEIVSY
jgi:heat shock 70kDa protein 1/2/6/8